MFQLGDFRQPALPLLVSLILYVAVVQAYRHRRKNALAASFVKDGRPLSEMTTTEAYGIISNLQELEFPSAFNKARKIALLKVSASMQQAAWHALLVLTAALTGRWHSYHVQTLRSHRAEYSAQRWQTLSRHGYHPPRVAIPAQGFRSICRCGRADEFPVRDVMTTLPARDA
jgi:hypothetical protein